MTKNRRPSVERLRELLEYNPETGVLRWKVDRTGGTKAGDKAGSEKPNGYVHVQLYGKEYKAHRIAWAMYCGEWPPANRQIDHINCDKADNRIENLRLATPSQNKANLKTPSHNASGYKGVSYHKGAKKWIAHIGKDSRLIHLGYYDTPEEAHAAYCKAAHELHGEFARTA